jgi:hypothetical protein
VLLVAVGEAAGARTAAEDEEDLLIILIAMHVLRIPTLTRSLFEERRYSRDTERDRENGGGGDETP